MDTQIVIREVESTYNKVKSLAGWTVDKNIVLSVTSYYITSTQEFSAVRLNQAMDVLKSKAGWLSPLRGQLLPMIAALIDRAGTDIEQEAERLLEKQNILRNSGFRNSIHSYLAALVLTDDPALYQKEAEQAKKLYDAMKKQHSFLTSKDDYAYAVLLGRRKADPAKHAASMRTYYDVLRKGGLRAGNELQWLSQVLTYLHIEYDEQNVEHVFRILKYLNQDLKVRPVHYPLIGFLSVFKVADKKIEEIVELTLALQRSKILKWNKDMALSIGMGYVMHQLADSSLESSVSLATSVEMIIQAQQAVMTATIAASVAASSSSSST